MALENTHPALPVHFGAGAPGRAYSAHRCRYASLKRWRDTTKIGAGFDPRRCRHHVLRAAPKQADVVDVGRGRDGRGSVTRDRSLSGRVPACGPHTLIPAAADGAERAAPGHNTIRDGHSFYRAVPTATAPELRTAIT